MAKQVCNGVRKKVGGPDDEVKNINIFRKRNGDFVVADEDIAHFMSICSDRNKRHCQLIVDAAMKGTGTWTG